MKRKITQRRRGGGAHDVRKELSKEQLAFHIRATAPNSHGLDGVSAIIKYSVKERYRIAEGSDMFIDFSDTIAAATQYRSYRDTAIHSRIVDVDHSIGEMTFRRDRVEEILLSEDALSKLYDHMFALRREIMEMIGFFQAIESWRSFTPDGSAIPHLIMERFHSRIAAMEEGQYGVLPSDPPDIQSLVQEAVIPRLPASAQSPSAASIISGDTDSCARLGSVSAISASRPSRAASTSRPAYAVY